MTAQGHLPTSADVARAAGVARSTVSNVLNNTPNSRISAQTRERVLQAARSLGYLGNAAAADLRRGGSRTILLLLDHSMNGALLFESCRLLARKLRHEHYTLLTVQTSGEITEEDARSWAALRPAAIVNMGARIGDDSRRILSATGALLLGQLDAEIPIVTAQADVARVAATALRDRGRSRLLQVLPREYALAHLTRARVAAFRRHAGPGFLGTRRMRLTPQSANELVDSLLRQPVRPDGIFAHNDDYAALLVAALLDQGVRVPDEIAVMGSDNAPWGAWMRPALSTIAYDAEAIADDLAAALVDITRDASSLTSVTVDFPSEVIHRQTT